MLAVVRYDNAGCNCLEIILCDSNNSISPKTLALKNLQKKLTGNHRISHVYTTPDTIYIVGESKPNYFNHQAVNGVTQVLLLQVKIKGSDVEVKEVWVDALNRETRVFVGVQSGMLFFYLFGWDNECKELIAQAVMVDPATF